MDLDPVILSRIVAGGHRCQAVRRLPPQASLSFLFWSAGLFVLPVIAIYTVAVYWIFRGKVRKAH